jgi:hypothetical protein
MQLFENFLELSKEIYGPVSREALIGGDILMHALWQSKQCIKSERQAVAIYKISSQLNGATHPESIKIKNKLDCIRQKAYVLWQKESELPFLAVFPSVLAMVALIWCSALELSNASMGHIDSSHVEWIH